MVALGFSLPGELTVRVNSTAEGWKRNQHSKKRKDVVCFCAIFWKLAERLEKKEAFVRRQPASHPCAFAFSLCTETSQPVWITVKRHCTILFG